MRTTSIAVWLTLMPVVAAAGDYGKVELLRDRWGTPHVFAETDRGAMFGLGRAAAEDRGLQMVYTLRIMQGRLAEVIGNVQKVRRNETAVQNDRKMRTFGFYRAAKEAARHLDAEDLAMLEAYSDGVNDYFKRHADELPGPFEKLGLGSEPWTPADCIVCWWHVGQFFATDGTRDLMRYRHLTEGPPPGRPMPPGRGGRGGRRGGGATREPADLKQLPPDESTAVVRREDVTDEWLARAHDFLKQHGYETDGQRKDRAAPEGPKFSHAWVADGETTGTGSAVLVSEPRTPVTNPSLFYEFHICGKTFNARGIGVAGSPVILIGFNRHVAWGVTALGADQADLFRLKTDAEHPDQYQFDGRWRKMDVRREEIRVKGQRSQSLVVRQTHLGPIINAFAFARPGDPPVALKRVPICEPQRETIRGGMAMLRARDVHEFYRALGDWRFPSANVVFGDRQGRIGFSLVGAIPLRSPLSLADGGAAHDGSAAKFDWAAIVPHELMPHVVDPERGCLFSGNHRPIGLFYPIPLGISTGSLGDTLRSWRLRELLEGKDELPPEYLLEIHDDTVNPARREIVRTGLHLRDVLRRELSADAARALERLAPWYRGGARSDLNVDGAALAMELNTFFRMMATDLALIYGGGESGLSYWLKTVGRRLDENPKAQIDAREQDFIDRALADAWTSATRKYGRDSAQWAQRARKQVTARKLGYLQSLDDFPSVDPQHDLTVPPMRCIDGGTIYSQTAQSYSQWVPLHNVDAARTILPIGSSERPENLMRTATYEDWSTGKLHAAPLSRQVVERDARGKVVLLP